MNWWARSKVNCRWVVAYWEALCDKRPVSMLDTTRQLQLFGDQA